MGMGARFFWIEMGPARNPIKRSRSPESHVAVLRQAEYHRVAQSEQDVGASTPEGNYILLLNRAFG